MHAPTLPLGVNWRSVLLLTVLSVLFLSATLVVGFALIPAGSFPSIKIQAPGRDDIGPIRLFLLVGCPLIYLWVCAQLGGKAGRLASLRYAMTLQLQAAAELLSFILVCWAVVLLLQMWGDTVHAADFQAWVHGLATADDTKLTVYVILLALPALSMLMTVWRLHALSRVPGAMAAAIEGSLGRRTVPVSGSEDIVRHELARYLERLTSSSAPGLGRVIYGSHPKLLSREDGGTVVYTLAWHTCPVKLLVSAHAVEGGAMEVRVRCVLRGGTYKLYVVETPVDVLAQMQYIDAQLLLPLSAQLARLGAERQRDALRDQALATQLRILQAQIEPHFLFNTLANVRQLYRSSVADGESMMDHLIAYLRCAMEDLRAEQSSVVKEMDLAMHFLSIMQIRMGERLSYQFSVPESLLHHPFPPAMLISLIENAIKHGLADSDHGLITMSAVRDRQALRVTVADNGAGFSSVGGTGVGLSNIRQRLEAMYGTRAWLEVGAPAAGGFTATIVIPIEERIH